MADRLVGLDEQAERDSWVSWLVGRKQVPIIFALFLVAHGEGSEARDLDDATRERMRVRETSRDARETSRAGGTPRDATGTPREGAAAHE